ncbi:RNA polymerase factor sigma-32 [Paroceanicella profunda]|uniref:RNA polymerase factor sigma-32 n=1 Tax=Paroceanicella profunda TaxID=2579971 RepID=A0A5B8FTE1_9RHOB|nr:RNA polymerase factor sigma-32 [Paroceanicella profunda]QDL91615.1 RNA polymerase factor sigma-32 [Paroceanicella profunda]
MALDHAFGERTPAPVARRAMRAEMLDAETELELARRWRDEQDEAALHRLVNAYVRLAISMAAKYRRYGGSMNDLTQEAIVGLMKAAAKFDPDRGVRFSTYAVWWIKASIQDYVMRNWSLVRTGSTSSQKALFFNLRRIRAKLEREGAQDGASMREQIATTIGVPLRDVEMMEARLSGSDFSLNALQAGEEGREWVETLEDEGPQASEIVGRRADNDRMRGWLSEAFKTLTERERLIIAARKLADEPRTLDSLGVELGLSKERVRQLEAQALRKLRKSLEARTGNAAQQFVVAA